MSKKTRGAVSVFLVLILVPCLVVTSVFVDVSRVEMSKSMANSSADLALNTLLTNYDADLKEWYGMVVSCQSIEDFYDITGQFFLRSLSSQGLSDDEIISLVDASMDLGEKYFGDDIKIVDLLKVECQTEVGKIVSETDGANLTNAAILRDQIVDFMKYRAPIEIISGIIERLSNDDSVSNAKDAEENNKLVEKKIDYYEAEGELLAAAFNTYCTIYSYYQKATNASLSNERLEMYAKLLAEYRNTYASIHSLMISNLYNTEWLEEYKRIKYDLDKYNSKYSKTDVSTRLEEGVYYISSSKITSLLTELEKKIDSFDSTKENFENAVSSLMSNTIGEEPSNANPIQWWVKMDDAVNGSSPDRTADFDNAAKAMLEAYSKALAIADCTPEEDVDESWKDSYDELIEKVKSRQKNYFSSTESNLDKTDTYVKAVLKLEEVSKNYKDKIKPENLTVTVYTLNSSNALIENKKSIPDALALISSDLSAMYEELNNCYIDLDLAINGNEDKPFLLKKHKVVSLDKLLELADKYQLTFDSWDSTADNTDTKMGEEDRGEIVDMKMKDRVDEIDKEAVESLKTRLNNIKSQLNDLLTAIENLKYGEKRLTYIASYIDFKDAAAPSVNRNNIGLTNSNLHSYSETTFKQLFKPNSDLVLEHTNDNNYDPRIDPATGKVNTPELFINFHKRFEGKTNVQEKVNETNDDFTKAEDKGKEMEKEAKGDRYDGGGTEIKHDFSGNDKFALGDMFSSVVDLFDNLINLNVDNIRDDLYVTTYIMEMFSYDTYQNEGLYNLYPKKSELNLLNYNEKYKEVMGAADKSEEENKGKWLSTDFEDFYNKSLTNQMINLKNNAAYGAEVEYILYGGEDRTNAKNVGSAYTDIFTIRYILNLVSGFQHFWTATDDNLTALAIEAIADAIQAATMGIVPAALTKVIIIPILTIFETATDLLRLKAGFPVEFYKAKFTDWWVRIPQPSAEDADMSDFTNNLGDPGKNDGDKPASGLFYSDYLTVFVYIGLSAGNATESMYQRMAEVIQANMRKLTNSEAYSMAKSRLYFTLDATIRVRPLMITLPYFNDYKNDMETKTDWCTYRIKMTRGYS